MWNKNTARPEECCIWLGRTDRMAGCIGLRRLDERRCEMKRLYVRPAFRGHGIAHTLVETILADARALGYRQMFLDTLPFLDTAIAMYRRFGFIDIPRYNDSPLDNTVYLRLDL
ncbi:MAG: GNAT family N-acetyltransferase [Dysosmobacter sp.]